MGLSLSQRAKRAPREKPRWRRRFALWSNEQQLRWALGAWRRIRVEMIQMWLAVVPLPRKTKRKFRARNANSAPRGRRFLVSSLVSQMRLSPTCRRVITGTTEVVSNYRVNPLYCSMRHGDDCDRPPRYALSPDTERWAPRYVDGVHARFLMRGQRLRIVGRLRFRHGRGHERERKLRSQSLLLRSSRRC